MVANTYREGLPEHEHDTPVGHVPIVGQGSLRLWVTQSPDLAGHAHPQATCRNSHDDDDNKKRNPKNQKKKKKKKRKVIAWTGLEAYDISLGIQTVPITLNTHAWS